MRSLTISSLIATWCQWRTNQRLRKIWFDAETAHIIAKDQLAMPLPSWLVVELTRLRTATDQDKATRVRESTYRYCLHTKRAQYLLGQGEARAKRLDDIDSLLDADVVRYLYQQASREVEERNLIMDELRALV